MNLEDIMLTEICQSQKDKYCMIPLTRYLESSSLLKQKVAQWLPAARGRGYCLMGMEFSLEL